MRHLDLFSGIGGFALATEMVWENVEHTFCDIEPFSQVILKKHWPQSYIYGDIRTLTANTEGERWRSQRPESTRQQRSTEPHYEVEQTYILTGGFPCQPFSTAGKRLGTEDDRHLWPEMLRVIREFHPRWVIGENVGGFITWNNGMVFEQVCADLEAAGYEVQAFIIPAVAIGAPHRRDRVWIVAHAAGERTRGRPNEIHGKDGRQNPSSVRNTEQSNKGHAPDSTSAGLERTKRPKQSGSSRRPATQNRRQSDSWNQNWPEVAARLCTMDDGLPNGLARPRGWRNAALKGAGNAIVPQVAAEIMRAIKEVDSL